MLSQQITISNHPDNVAVFNAGSTAEALLIASEEFKKPAIQAALWLNKQSIFDEAKDSALRREFRKVMGHKPYENDGIGQKSVEITLELKRSRRSCDPITIGFQSQDFDFQQFVSPDRIQMMQELGHSFGLVRLGVRHELVSNFHLHTDTPGMAKSPKNADKLFEGRRIRILDSRTHAGTYVYSPDDKDGKKPWETPLNAPLFIGGEDWGLEKAILHSAPSYVASQPNRPRVLDVYDCFF